VRRTRFDEWPCPIARTTDLIGDWWTPLVLRELFSGRSRFDDIQEALGCSRAVLTQRLNRLIDEGMLVKVPYERWWEIMLTSQFDEAEGFFVHPVQNERVMAGNGTIGLELADDIPDADAVLVPWGGGGLFTGIASALAALRPDAQVYAVQPETGAAVTAALEAGEPSEAEYQPSFVDGAGAKVVLPAMWEQARPLLAGAYTVTLDETAAAVRLLAERARVIAEGAGALAVAAAVSGRVPGRKLVCIVSGGNIDANRLATILAGGTPD